MKIVALAWKRRPELDGSNRNSTPKRRRTSGRLRLWAWLLLTPAIALVAGCSNPNDVNKTEPKKETDKTSATGKGDAGKAEKDAKSTPHADATKADGTNSGSPNTGVAESSDTQTSDAPPAVADTSADASADATAAANAGSVAATKVMLGGPELTSGIPGDGPLTNEQIRAWLDDPKNHETLEVELPLGLSLGALQVVGLDDNPLTRARIELGRQLYFDPRLSHDSTISCASCHNPDTAYAAPTQFGVGIAGQTGNRNSPVAYNRILSGPQFWDGRAASLEEQAIGPIANPIEMDNTHEACVQCLEGVEGYKMQFDKVFGELTIEAVGKAIASFERVVVTGPSAYDFDAALDKFRRLPPEDLEFLEEDDPAAFAEYRRLLAAAEKSPLSESAARGKTLFFSDKSRCATCHVGANFADEKYHNLGVGMDAKEPDLGRFTQTNEDNDRGAFKTPTLRNVAQTAPYMHDGSQNSLDEVVEWYAKGGHPNDHLSDKIVKLDLSEQDKKDLVEFMKALTGELTPVEKGRLPQ